MATKDLATALLEERFRLGVHHEDCEGPVYSLDLAKGGTKLKRAAFRDDDCPDEGSCHTLTDGQGLGCMVRRSICGTSPRTWRTGRTVPSWTGPWSSLCS